jgi:hypothetical protein
MSNSSGSGDKQYDSDKKKDCKNVPVKKSVEWPVPVEKPSEDATNRSEHRTKYSGNNSNGCPKQAYDYSKNSSRNSDPNRKSENNKQNNEQGGG